jgi:hypothetical protein
MQSHRVAPGPPPTRRTQPRLELGESGSALRHTVGPIGTIPMSPWEASVRISLHASVRSKARRTAKQVRAGEHCSSVSPLRLCGPVACGEATRRRLGQ